MRLHNMPRAAPPLASRGIASGRVAAWIAWSPIGLAVLFTVLFAAPPLRPLHEWVLGENHPVELLTFLSLLAAGVAALWMSRNKRFTRGDILTSGFFALFGIGLVFTAMEEISYGQTFLSFDTPSFFAEHNLQGEPTLHNLPGLHGHNSFLRLALGLGGLIGVWAARGPRFARIAPPFVLMPWFLTITVLAGVDVFITFHTMGARIDLINEQLTEVVEMMVGLAALLYVWLCSERARIADRGG